MTLLALVVIMIYWIKNLSKSKKPPALKDVFIFLKLAFTDIWIKTKFWSSLFFKKQFFKMLDAKLTMRNFKSSTGFQNLKAQFWRLQTKIKLNFNPPN